MRDLLLDTGPLVAFLNRPDRHHAWAKQAWQQAAVPLTTCEAVISEAMFLLRALPGAQMAVLELIARGVVRIEPVLVDNVRDVRVVMKKYANLPTSLADACLVCLADRRPKAAVMTLASEFSVYRRRDGHAIEVVRPEAGG